MYTSPTEKELIRKLVFSGHINVAERRALPDQKAKASLMRAVIEDALQSGEFFRAWWMPDDSMAGCLIQYRGDGVGRVLRTYSGIEGEGRSVLQYASIQEAAADLIQQARPFIGNNIDGVPIDWDA